ncbi:hypothetical protein FA15DRAFT_756460 [Coprinopsis marcescibilis]|uniref:Zn(2)-C6 fungal-type domain-containing protein n=1 Tax=Coprinopsis marcescibilis TaxID=230819 RepID=A0A5C3KWL6_COPMA|nr:hypothetical protein FA15DRAFT_756460 [Coprinopsis marcescibilis]
MDYRNPPSAYQEDMQLRQFHLQYSPPAGQDKMTSSAHYRSESVSSPSNVHGLPHLARQNSAGIGRNTNLGGFPNYMPPLHQQRELYPAPPSQIDQDIHQVHYPYPSVPSLRQHQHRDCTQSWPPHDPGLRLGLDPAPTTGLSVSYDSFPSSSPYPAPLLSPPTLFHHGGLTHNPRSLAGSLDPATGVFYRTPDHPRLRTAQACEKCRSRKAKCSGEHPSCKRCINRGLVCVYAKEGRVRGPNKPKVKAVTPAEEPASDLRGRISTTHAFGGGNPREHQSVVSSPCSTAEVQGAGPFGESSLFTIAPHQRRNSLSLDQHRPNRPRPPNLQLETSSSNFRIQVPQLMDDVQPPGFRGDQVYHQVSISPRTMYQSISGGGPHRHGQESTSISQYQRFALTQVHLPSVSDANMSYQTTSVDMGRLDEPGQSDVVHVSASGAPLGYQQEHFAQRRGMYSRYEVPITHLGASEPSSDYDDPVASPIPHNLNAQAPSQEYVHMEFEALQQPHADNHTLTMAQNPTPNLTPTWVELNPAYVAGSSGPTTRVPSSEVNRGFHPGEMYGQVPGQLHCRSDSESNAISVGPIEVAHSQRSFSGQDPHGGEEGSPGLTDTVTHNYQMDSRLA